MSIVEVSIDINYQCPFACPFCSTGSNLIPTEINLDTAEHCLEFMKQIFERQRSDIRVVISGGEPLISDKLESYIELWHSVSKDITLCTTGALEMGLNYWKDLRHAGLQTARLSLHSTSEHITKGLFGESYSLPIVDATMKHIAEANIILDINFVLNRFTINHIEDIFRYSKDQQIRCVRILGLSRQGQAVQNWESLKISEKEEHQATETINKMSLAYKIAVEFAGLPSATWCSHSDNKGNCLGGNTFFHITTNGDIYPCPGLKSMESYRIDSVFQLSEKSSLWDFCSIPTNCIVANSRLEMYVK